ncbi:hypothetical protein PHSY_001140 [Pseudozyma hubeiensis SY62]|uniref:Uncharacterized protein n=1 Tax=Pseudozyma hubeiensis (strain SY62) TaxID=1305764 RepID=R9P633_PSEHS|nr:hypothetical protein PHSY_001140 [Pseudozyma hubeiensis SY62]GAC93575.1 hypothetical protein PHSY_001140 [Pseudozyma hubeiensis SY62]
MHRLPDHNWHRHMSKNPVRFVQAPYIEHDRLILSARSSLAQLLRSGQKQANVNRTERSAFQTTKHVRHETGSTLCRKEVAFVNLPSDRSTSPFAAVSCDFPLGESSGSCMVRDAVQRGTAILGKIRRPYRPTKMLPASSRGARLSSKRTAEHRYSERKSSIDGSRNSGH